MGNAGDQTTRTSAVAAEERQAGPAPVGPSAAPPAAAAIPSVAPAPQGPGIQTSLFRREVIENRLARAARAEIIRIDPEATTWGFRLLMGGILGLIFFAAFGRLNEYASGPAFVRLNGTTALTAAFDGLVGRVDVAPGDQVKAGDALVHFNSNVEEGELAAASHEFDDQLGKLLQHPEDPTARQALVSLRSRRELARAHLELRTLRAPRAGIIGDIRVREGQLVEAGRSVLELQEAATEATVVALLPGRYRPLIREGDSLRFELDGFRQRAYELKVKSVGSQIVGPAEAARYVGRDSADSLVLAGPVVLVQATLPSTTFQADGRKYFFAGGMNGKAELAVRNEPVAFAFVPTLKVWIDHVHPQKNAPEGDHP